MNIHKLMSRPKEMGMAIMHMSPHSSLSKLFVSSIAISYFTGFGGGLYFISFGVVNTKYGRYKKTDYTAQNNA